MLRELPQNINAEKEVIGAILINNKVMDKVIEYINQDSFYSTKHKHIFNAMYNLYRDKQPIDLVTLFAELGQKLTEAIQVSYISDIMSSTITYRNAEQHAKILKECHSKRLLIKSLYSALDVAYDNESSEVKKELANSLITVDKEKEELDDMASIIDKTFTSIQEAADNGNKISGIETGLDSFDRNSNGIKKQEVTIIAARPSMGKTAFVLNLARNMSKANKVLMFELEMDTVSIGVRLLQSEAKIDGLKMKRGILTTKEWEDMAQASNRIINNNFLLDTRGGISWEQMEQTIKKAKLQDGIDVVVIDHLGLIRIANKDRNREIGEITGRAKALAKELDIAIVFLSQLSRVCEQRADHRPMLSDLRDSGSIEQDADLITFLYRDEYYNKETEDRNTMEAIIAKNRNGAVGTVKLYYQNDIQLIRDLWN